MPSLDSALPHDSRNTSGNVFESLFASRRTILISLRKFKEFGTTVWGSGMGVVGTTYAVQTC